MLCGSEPEARPGQTVEQHLTGTRENVRLILEIHRPPILAEYQTEAEECAERHDIGKNTEYFQDVLKRKKKPNQFSEHSRISGLYFYNTLKHLGKISLICTHSIQAHHSKLDLGKAFVSTSNINKHWNILNHQLNKMLVGRYKNGLPKTEKEFRELNHLIRESVNNLRSQYIPENFFLLQGMYSLLVLADRLNAAEINLHQPVSCSYLEVDRYLQEKQKTLDMNKLQAKQEVLDVLKQMSNDEIMRTKIFTLTAPTGLGKTLISLQAALYLKSRLDMMNIKSRIIYAVPFLNIAEQIRDDIEGIFKDARKIYHFSSPVEIKDEFRTIDEYLLNLQAWNADIILTSFVQFFESLVSNKPADLIKFVNISNAVVILDEIQALPDEYKAFAGAVMVNMAKHYGTRFIITTATQPKIFQFTEQAKIEKDICSKELLERSDFYFKRFSGRTEIISALDEPIDNPEKFLRFFMKYYEGGTALVVVNTIKTSIDIFNMLVTKYPGQVGYLSTNIIPLKRQDVIGKFKSRKIKILVSTQTVEAGVDIDADIGFRALAPWEALVQTAGRINRYGVKPTSKLYVFEYSDGSQHVYSSQVLDLVKEMLQMLKRISDSRYRSIVEEYYSKYLKDNTDLSISKKLWESVCIVDHKSIDFKLIRDRGIEVFVEFDQRATEIADIISEFYGKGKNLREKIFLAYGREFYDTPYERRAWKKIVFNELGRYIVNVCNPKGIFPEFSAGREGPSWLFWIPRHQLDEYYDQVTGIKNSNVFLY